MLNKKFFSVAIISAVLFTSGCGANGVEIPDLKGVEANTAKDLLAGKSLIPRIKYIYNSKIVEGEVVKTSPAAGILAEPDTAVTLYVSQGPKRIDALDSSINWTFITYADDDWEFYTPYILKDVLVIECEPKFGVAMSWRSSNGNDAGFGRASISDTFDKTVPVEIQYEKKFSSANERQSITLNIPIADLDVQRPTTVYLELYAKVNGSDEDVKIDFSISWPS